MITKSQNSWYRVLKKGSRGELHPTEDRLNSVNFLASAYTHYVLGCGGGGPVAVVVAVVVGAVVAKMSLFLH